MKWPMVVVALRRVLVPALGGVLTVLLDAGLLHGELFVLAVRALELFELR